tara:strand:- start:745 stop:1113 length:369 start_codon:yes stop_codon:yes gene_type:complete
MGKYERAAKRRQRKEQQRDVERGIEKHKERKDKENKMKTWRRDQQGNIIFKGALKFSKTAIIGLAAFTIIIILFAVAVITNEETAGACKNPFCQFLGIDSHGKGSDTFAPPTSGTTEERVLP